MPLGRSPHNLTDVPRNDLDAAKAYYEHRGGVISASEWHVLYRLQDDSTEFEQLSAEWNVREGD